MLTTRPPISLLVLLVIGPQAQATPSAIHLLTAIGVALGLLRQQLIHTQGSGATTVPRFSPVVPTFLLIFSYDTIAVPGVNFFLRTLL